MANLITILRIALSIILLTLKINNNVFLILYSICGVTDILDGYIARKTKTESELGSRLDSLADLLLGLVIAKIIYPIFIENKLCMIWIFLMAIIKITSIVIICKKYKTFAIIHTYLNKTTGLLIFLYVYFKNNLTIFYIVCFIATIAAIEEICINIKSSKLEIDKKTIFIK